jgi:hypothetical protein
MSLGGVIQRLQGEACKNTNSRYWRHQGPGRSSQAKSGFSGLRLEHDLTRLTREGSDAIFKSSGQLNRTSHLSHSRLTVVWERVTAMTSIGTKSMACGFMFSVSSRVSVNHVGLLSTITQQNKAFPLPFPPHLVPLGLHSCSPPLASFPSR